MTLTELRGLLAARLPDPIALNSVLEEVMCTPRAQLILQGAREVTDVEFHEAVAFADAVVAGVPLQHVIGHWSFRSLELTVDGRALIPRPETEVTVSVALDELVRFSDARTVPATHLFAASTSAPGPAHRAFSLVSCRGSLTRARRRDRHQQGGTSLACERGIVHALDEPFRMIVARAAAGRLVQGRFLPRNWTPRPGSAVAEFDLICANPPYLSEREWLEVDAIVRDHDPVGALVAGAAGTEQIELILEGAAEHLTRGGVRWCSRSGWQQGPGRDAPGATTAGAANDVAIPSWTWLVEIAFFWQGFEP